MLLKLTEVELISPGDVGDVRDCYVNPHRIDSIIQRINYSILAFAGQDRLLVRESAEEIAAMVVEAAHA